MARFRRVRPKREVPYDGGATGAYWVHDRFRARNHDRCADDGQTGQDSNLIGVIGYATDDQSLDQLDPVRVDAAITARCQAA